MAKISNKEYEYFDQFGESGMMTYTVELETEEERKATDPIDILEVIYNAGGVLPFYGGPGAAYVNPPSFSKSGTRIFVTQFFGYDV